MSIITHDRAGRRSEYGVHIMGRTGGVADDNGARIVVGYATF
ncbi:hypothetical protein ACIBG0_05995 [Nocardia sp. NPDC050630]